MIIGYAVKCVSEPNVQFAGIDAKKPLTRDSFLRGMMRQDRSRAERLAEIGKAFVRDMLREKGPGKEPTQDEVHAAYGDWRPYSSDVEVNLESKRFEDWYRRHITHVRRAAGKHGSWAGSAV